MLLVLLGWGGKGKKANNLRVCGVRRGRYFFGGKTLGRTKP